MAKEQSKYEIFYQTMGACIWACVTEDEPEMDAFYLRFEQNPIDWKHALVCGFYRMGYQNLGMVSQDTADELEFTVAGRSIGKFSCANPPDFYDLDAESFVQILFAKDLKEDAAKWEDIAKLDIIRKGYDTVRKYDDGDKAVSLDEMKNMAIGLGKLILFYPPFFDETQRDDVIEQLCYRITEDVLGEWPAK